MTDLCTNNEWNGKCQQEDGGDDDINGALRPSSLQAQPAKRVTHALRTTTGPREKYLKRRGGHFFAVSDKQTNKPWGRSAATATSLYSALSSAWNGGSRTSWLCGQKSGGWRIWRKAVSAGERARACTVKWEAPQQLVDEKAASRWQRFTALAVDSCPELPLGGRVAKKTDVGWLWGWKICIKISIFLFLSIKINLYKIKTNTKKNYTVTNSENNFKFPSFQLFIYFISE